MNIVIITTLFPVHDPNNKNTKADYYLAKEWIKAGHKVAVLFAEGDLFFRNGLTVKKEEYFYDGISVFHLKYPRFIPRYQDPLLLTRDIIRRWALNCLNKTHFNKIDLFYCDFPAGNWTLINYLKQRKEFSISMFVPVFNNCDFYSKRKVKAILNKSHIVGVRSKAMQERIDSYKLQTKVFIVYSGVPKTAHKESELKVKSGKRPTKTMYAGDFITLKNVDILIECFRTLANKHSDLTLTLVGDGPEEKQLKQKVELYNLADRVAFTGRMDRELVFKTMLDSDVFVMASSPESFGIVYIEAMAAGCCVVACQNEGIDGVIVDKLNGFLVKPRDVDNLAKVLDDYICMTNQDRIKLLTKSYETAQGFSEKDVATRVLDDIFYLFRAREEL